MQVSTFNNRDLLCTTCQNLYRLLVVLETNFYGVGLVLGLRTLRAALTIFLASSQTQDPTANNN